MDAETEKSNQVSVLQLRNEYYFISELQCPLARALTKPFHSNFFVIS
jgi:hypothetical protein